MDMGKFFSLKDFFYYYFAGLIWIIDLFILYILIRGTQNIFTLTAQIQTSNDALDIFLAAVLTILLPYITGFSLNSLGECITNRWIQDDRDPVKWTVDYTNNQKEGSRIVKPAVRKICELANNIFAFQINACEDKQKPDASRWFYYIRTYVEHKGGTASFLATRTLDLARFAESLLIPVPLFFGLISFATTVHTMFAIWTALTRSWAIAVFVVAVIIAVAVAVGLYFLLKKRYEQLREYWVKHIYRTFLVIATEELQKIRKQEDKVGKQEKQSH